jgi:hypothetical protein
MAQIRLPIEAFPVALLLSTKSPQILVKTSRSGRNWDPSRLLSRPLRLRGPPQRESTRQRAYRHIKSGLLRARGINETYRHFGPGLLP